MDKFFNCLGYFMLTNLIIVGLLAICALWWIIISQAITFLTGG